MSTLKECVLRPIVNIYVCLTFSPELYSPQLEIFILAQVTAKLLKNNYTHNSKWNYRSASPLFKKILSTDVLFSYSFVYLRGLNLIVFVLRIFPHILRIFLFPQNPIKFLLCLITLEQFL